MNRQPETGQLDLRPDSPAYATQLRLITARLVAAANEAAGTQAVRTVRVLPPGTTPAPRTTPKSPAATPNVSQAPVKKREMGSAGFHQALAAHRQAARPSRVDPAIEAAVQRQTTRNAGAGPPGVPRAARAGQRTGPARPGPCRAPPPGRRLPRRRAAPGPCGARGKGSRNGGRGPAAGTAGQTA